jgi:hypothetical protein
MECLNSNSDIDETMFIIRDPTLKILKLVILQEIQV